MSEDVGSDPREQNSRSKIDVEVHSSAKHRTDMFKNLGIPATPRSRHHIPKVDNAHSLYLFLAS